MRQNQEINIYTYGPRNRKNNRIGKTIDLFKKIRDNKGTIRVKMGSIKDRNGRDLTKAGEI